MRDRAGLLIVAMVAAFALTGCGGDDPAPAATDPATATGLSLRAWMRIQCPHPRWQIGDRDGIGKPSCERVDSDLVCHVRGHMRRTPAQLDPDRISRHSQQPAHTIVAVLVNNDQQQGEPHPTNQIYQNRARHPNLSPDPAS